MQLYIPAAEVLRGGVAELVEVLRDPQIQGIMQECAADAGRFRYYLQVPEVRKKLLVMRKAGLVQF